MKQKSNRTFIFLVIFTVICKSETGLLPRPGRTTREIYPEIEPEKDTNQAQVCIVGDVVYASEEAVPADQPCLECRCRPPAVQCETMQCRKTSGCKAVHRPNSCCPDYQCECELNGKTYANGERLETEPGGECKVCYCRGGELQCAEVSCYIRNDCEGKRVPGQCCPRYDHCPPIDAVPDRLTTDITSNNANLDVFQATTPPIQENKIPTEEERKDASPSKITIQEIIPERKEIPVTAPASKPELHGTLIIEEAISNNASNDLDAETDSSEVSEIFHHPPPVLRIGDKLLFLKKGEFVAEKDTSSPASIITIIGAEGLQRGGLEDSGEEQNTTVKKKHQEDAIQEQNPAYPVLPDEMGQEFGAEGKQTKIDEETKIFPDVLAMRSNKTIPGNVTNDNWLKNGGTLINYKAVLPEELLKQPAPSDVEEIELTTIITRNEEAEDATTDPPEATSTVEEELVTEKPETMKNSSLNTAETLTEQIPYIEDLQNPKTTNDPSLQTGNSSKDQDTPIGNLKDTKTIQTSSRQSAETFQNEMTSMRRLGETKTITNPSKPTEETSKNQITSMEGLEETVNNNTSSLQIQDTSNVENTSMEGLEEPKTITNYSLPTEETSLDPITSMRSLEEPQLNNNSSLQTEETPKKQTPFMVNLEETKGIKNTSQWKEEISNEQNTTIGNLEESKTIHNSSLQSEETLQSEMTTAKSFEDPENVKNSSVEAEFDMRYLGGLNDPKTNNNSSSKSEESSTDQIMTPETIPNHSLSEEETPMTPTESIGEAKTITKTDETTKNQTTSITSLEEPITIIEQSEDTTNDDLRSVESLEESGEATTRKTTNHSSIQSEENASVETIEQFTSEASDMAKTYPENTETMDTIETKPEDTQPLDKDVELVDISSLNRPKPTERMETTTHEHLPKPEQMLPSKKVLKRENNPQDETGEVFKQLEREITAEDTPKTVSKEEERQEAEEIFKELLEETGSPGKARNTETETLDKISNALAQLAFRGAAPDVSILGVLSRFFSSQPNGREE